jgi:hypothetical protein
MEVNQSKSVISTFVTPLQILSDPHPYRPNDVDAYVLRCDPVMSPTVRTESLVRK